MAKQFTQWQLNNLLTGNRLTAEIPSSSPDLQRFVTISAFDPESGLPSKFLNADHSQVRFGLGVIEVERAHLAHEDVSSFAEDLYKIIYIPTLEALAEELGKFLDDFAALDVPWRRAAAQDQPDDFGSSATAGEASRAASARQLGEWVGTTRAGIAKESKAAGTRTAATQFTQRQLDELRTGTLLAAEIPASSEARRAFALVAAYDPEDPLWKYREDTVELGQLRFRLFVFEIERAEIERGDVDAPYHKIREIRGLHSPETLAEELGKFLDDFAALDDESRVVPI